MSRILHLALHDTRLFVLARESIFFMFIMPVMFMLFFSSVLGGGDPSRIAVSLPVVDEDGGWLAAAFAAQLRGERFEVDVHTPAAADSLDLTRRVVIPAGFTERLLAGERVTVRMEKSARSNEESDFAADVRLRRAQAAFLGNLVRWDAERRAGATPGDDAVLPPPDAAARERLLALVAEAPRVTVKSEFAGRGRPVPRGAGQSIPGMLAMFVFMTTLIGGAESLTREKHSGTLARLASTPLLRGDILTGKLMHLSLVAVIQALVLMAAGEAIGRLRLFGISFSWGAGWPAVVVLVAFYGVAVGCLTLFVGGLFRTTQQAESLGWLVGMVMAAMGGCWWPSEIMPAAVRAVAHAFPTYWAMQALHGVITFGRGLEAVLLPALVLTGFALLFGALGARSMRLA